MTAHCSQCRHTAGLTLSPDGLILCPAHAEYDQRRRRIRAALTAEPRVRHADIAHDLGINPRDVSAECARLIANGTLNRCEHHGVRRG